MASREPVKAHCVVCDNLTPSRGERNVRLAGTVVTCEHCKTTILVADSVVRNYPPGCEACGEEWGR